MSRSGKKGGLRRLTGRIAIYSLKLLFFLFFITVVQVSLIRFFNPPFTAMTAWKFIMEKTVSRQYARQDRYWRDLKDISPNLIRAVLAAEDQRFMDHHGFDFIEMNHAIRDIIQSRRVRGASTITMQVARTIFLWPGRSLARKVLEGYYTILIELFWSKTRILEIYLNFVDWGVGINGAEAASRKYFKISSDQINTSQAALLAAILPSPHKWSPINPDPYVKERQQRIIRDMKNMHL